MLSLHMDIRLLIVSSAAPMLVAAACMAGLGVAIRGASRDDAARD
jgi:hypothetical protein